MINFFWIVLIAVVIAAIVSGITIAGLYLFWDSIVSFIIKRKAKKYDLKDIEQRKKELKDGGDEHLKKQKEVQKEDGTFRDYERLRSEGIARATERDTDGERTAEDENTLPRQFAAESRDAKINAIASEFNKRDSGADKSW